ncbi:MmcQ/YjbR family DNA-binding protein [Ciceribacter sp. L1K23]|uniref:MmcQ/YjbR family DNA-binding protein n=1 Tax=Ciceribacter sp. L1K23 TaxID=2820276 RepID=UPI001B8255C2|nr:MmcQ/YjbR family DNA-binding protein [Ciceribacter sp. L1K23]MBR0556666.1 MmcQ/YjbR family DNA-binding protein [Ciceribacter sp. L1K23]
MITLDRLREIVLSFPDTEETTSWDAVSFKVNKKAILFWNPTHDCPVFKVPYEERDHLIEMDPETFFTTDHHRPHPMVLARPQQVDEEWVRVTVERTWRAQVKKATLKAWDGTRNERAGAGVQ